MNISLSEAIILGDSLRQRNPQIWLDEKDCGCAIGGALKATGRDAAYLASGEKIDFIHKEWPWLQHGQLQMISMLFADVCSGTRSIEDLADYVHNIEPKEVADGSSVVVEEELVAA